MFRNKSSKSKKHPRYDQPLQPTNQFALAAARAIGASRSQTPTLSAAAAAAALHASPKQVTSPGAVVTRRMERRGSVTSITSAPPLGRRGSDASMTERIGWLRGSDDSSGSRSRPMSRDAASPTRGGMRSPTRMLKRVSIDDQSATATAARNMTLGQLESRHAPKDTSSTAPKKSVPKSGAKPPVKSALKHRDVEQQIPPPLKKPATKPARKQSAARPKTAPEQAPIPAALVAAAAAAVPAAKRQQLQQQQQQQPKAKPKPKPKPVNVEPVRPSSPEEEEERKPVKHDFDFDFGLEESPAPSSFALKKSLRSAPAEAEVQAPAKKKKKPIQTPSDTQGGMLSRGTMRTAVREDMIPIIDDAKARNPQPKVPKSLSDLGQSMHAPKTELPIPAPPAPSAPSDAVKALALQIMKEQQAKAAGQPILLPSRRAEKRQAAAAAAAAEDFEEPDTLDDEDGFAAEQEEEEELEAEEQLDENMYARQQFAGSVTSFTSDLESIPEEASHDNSSPRDGKKKKKKRPVPDSVIIPGRDGVPALPQSPILEHEKHNIAKVSSPEPQSNKHMERRRTLEKLESESPTAQSPPILKVAIGESVSIDDTKASPPSSATLTEEVVQSVVIQTIPPTPPAIETDKEGPPPRLFALDSSEDESMKPAKANGAITKLKTKTPSPPNGRHSPRLMKRHSPPPRSVSPAKSAMKHTHYEGSDRSSILSTEDAVTLGKRKHVRVSFSEDPSVVEMDDDSYHYKPIHSALDKASEKKASGKGVSGVSFNSFSRMRAERTPSPQPEPQEHSSDSRLAGLIGTELLGKLRGKGKKEGLISPPPPGLAGQLGKRSGDFLAPEVTTASPAPSISDEELESDLEEGGVTIPLPPPAPLTDPVPEAVIPEESSLEEPVQEEPKEAQIAAGHTPPAVEVKPIFPPSATSDLTGNTATISENISQGRPAAFKDDSDEAEEHFSDAYEDLDHVVLSATGSGAVIGVTTAHTVNQPETQQPAAETVVLPSIAEVTDQPMEAVRLSTPPTSLAPVVAPGPLPEQEIEDTNQEPHVILAPKPIKPVSPRLINTASPPPRESTPTKAVLIIPAAAEPTIEPVAETVVSPKTNGVSKPAAKKATKPKSALAESKHAPKVKTQAAKVTPTAKATTKASPASAPATGTKLKKRTSVSGPVPAPAPQRRLSVDSDDSESSFQRENPHRRAARRIGGGFSMRTSMRDASGRVPVDSANESGLSSSRWADSSPTTPRFESGFRGRAFGTGGPRQREYSPDSSDDETRRITLRNTAKNEKKGRFLGKATLRSSSTTAARRPSSSSMGFGGLSGFKSRFADSSDEEEDMVSSPPPQRLSNYRPLTPDSSDEEVQVNGNGNSAAVTATSKQKKGGLGDSVHAPVTTMEYDFATPISAEIEPKKKWWSFGSRRRSSTSRPASRAGSMVVPSVTERPPVGDRRTSDPQGLGTTLVSQANPRPGMKFRRLSGGSVNSVSSNRTWTQSLGTSTLVGSPTVANGRTTLTHGRLEELQEEDEEDEELRYLQQQTNGARDEVGKAQVTQPNGDIYGATKAGKKKKFPRLRRMFGIED
ncbi:hypothetical protein TWF694_006531 [Orbilia ellipsospora]|uniref:Uncharacterized protein n=1 Tax=Orbilia ellipsospora TaxID=2528407 RepID=A0AAV9XKE6_9PEZI